MKGKKRKGEKERKEKERKEKERKGKKSKGKKRKGKKRKEKERNEKERKERERSQILRIALGGKQLNKPLKLFEGGVPYTNQHPTANCKQESSSKLILRLTGNSMSASVEHWRDHRLAPWFKIHDEIVSKFLLIQVIAIEQGFLDRVP